MFSQLVSATRPTSKYNVIPGRRVDRLIIHHTAGGSNAANLERLSTSGAEVSATYCLTTTGELVGIVPEEHRPWTSNSPGVDADINSVTVETVNTSGDPGWGVADIQLEMLASLAADLCKRYGWGRLDRNRVIGHRQVAQTACPGPYLYPRLESIVNRANQLLAGGTPSSVSSTDLEDQMKYFSGRSTRKTKQVLKAGTTSRITYRDDPADNRTIVRGPGDVVNLIASLQLKGKPGKRFVATLVKETGENKNTVEIGRSRGSFDTIGLAAIQVSTNSQLKPGELVRTVVQTAADAGPVTVDAYSWNGYARP